MSADHDISALLNLVGVAGKLIIVGLPAKAQPFDFKPLVMRARTVVGSLIGGVKETQEMLDFCAEKKVLCDIELIKMESVNEAYVRMEKSDVKYRFVIDCSTIKA